MLKNHFSTSLGKRNSWRAFISNISPEAHENQLQVCHEFLQQHSFTLAFNSDCSRALLSASGKMNDCPSGKKKVFDTHTPQGQENGKKKMFEASWCSPASWNTNLTICQSPEGRWFFPYLQQSQQMLFPTHTAECRHSFPLTSHTAVVTVSFHFFPQVVYAVSTSSLSFFKCKKSAPMNREE